MSQKSKTTRRRDEHAAEGALPIVDKKVIRRNELASRKRERKCMASHAAKSDIRNIMKGVRQRKVIPQISKTMVTGDMTKVPDLMTAMNTIETAKESFRNMPAIQREFFNNDPIKFMQFMQKPEKSKADFQKALELGIINERKPEPKPDPQKVVIVKDETAETAKK